MHGFSRRHHPLIWSAAALLLAGCAEGIPTEPHAFSSPSLAEAANLNAPAAGYIRIGIVNGVTSVRIGGTGDFEVRNKASNALLTQGSNQDLDVSLSSRVVFYNFLYLQVGCIAETSANEHAARLAQAGYQSKVVKHATVNCWRVLAGEFPTTTPSTVTDAFRDELVAKNLAPTNAFRSPHSWSEGVQEFQISRGGTQVATSSDQVVLTPTSGEVRINGRRYRGVGEVLANSAGLAGVNELPLEEYLYGVVPRELPPVPYGAPEAQKAQAVTARTYALANFNKQMQHGFNLTNTTTDQVYGGLQDEHPVSSAAVDATRGIVAAFQGRLISTLYHSTSGGFTANSEDVYANRFEYLRGVPDAERGRAFENVPTIEVFKRHANPTNLRAAAEGDFEADWSRYHRWVVEWTAAEMTRALSSSQSFNTPVGTVHSIEVVKRADHGRVLEIVFGTDAGEFRAFKDNIRTRLPYVTSTGALTSLRSTMFFIEPVIDRRTRTITGWKAYGGGWGHGVGMSQTGAVGMAERGRSYEEILKHYYQGVELEQR
jgi:stage II sporulation protein D